MKRNLQNLSLKRVGLILGNCLFLIGCQTSGFITPPTLTGGSSLNTLQSEGQPHFSHDGRYLVFVSDRAAQRQILLYDTQRHQLIPLPELNRDGIMQDQPDISADGRYIVYVSEQTGKPDIWLYDRQSFTSQNLTQNHLGEVRYPTISGNGRFIAFEQNRKGQWDITLYDRGIEAVTSPSNLSERQNP